MLCCLKPAIRPRRRFAPFGRLRRSLLQQMEGEHDPGRETRIASKKAALRRMNELREQLEAVVGPSTNNPVAHLPYKELRSQALLGHWEEKGLL